MTLEQKNELLNALIETQKTNVARSQSLLDRQYKQLRFQIFFMCVFTVIAGYYVYSIVTCGG